MQINQKIVWCDNGGENVKLEKELNGEKWKLGVKFEYTARDTKIPLKLSYIFFKEAFKYATLLDGLSIFTLNGKTATRYEHWGGEVPKFVKRLRT